jgi:hypothetical protein
MFACQSRCPKGATTGSRFVDFSEVSVAYATLVAKKGDIRPLEMRTHHSPMLLATFEGERQFMQGSIRSPQLGQEYPQPNEEAMFREMGEIIEKLMIRTRTPVQRQQHAKHHGCVRATFEVEQNLPDELRIGLFKDVTNYPAWVRFSNASQHIDTIGNPHGFAIKLMGVKGAKALGEGHDHETQDFLMVDYPIFIVRTASDYRCRA